MSPEGQITETLAELAPVESTGRASTLDHVAAGCVRLASDDEGKATAGPQDGDASAGRAADADASPDKAAPRPPATLREFEHALRALGYSARQAKAIAREGFRPAASAESEPEPDTDMQTLMAALQRRAAALKGT